MSNSIVRVCVFLVLLTNRQSVFGDVDTISSDGINSAGLGLSGAGIGIGQVEPMRPGVPGTDPAGSVHTSVVPAGVSVKMARQTWQI